MINHKEQGWPWLEKIDTDYKQWICKIEVKLFNMRKQWLNSFNFTEFFLKLWFIRCICLGAELNDKGSYSVFSYIGI